MSDYIPTAPTRGCLCGVAFASHFESLCPSCRRAECDRIDRASIVALLARLEGERAAELDAACTCTAASQAEARDCPACDRWSAEDSRYYPTRWGAPMLSVSGSPSRPRPRPPQAHAGGGTFTGRGS